MHYNHIRLDLYFFMCHFLINLKPFFNRKEPCFPVTLEVSFDPFSPKGLPGQIDIGFFALCAVHVHLNSFMEKVEKVEKKSSISAVVLFMGDRP